MKNSRGQSTSCGSGAEVPWLTPIRFDRCDIPNLRYRWWPYANIDPAVDLLGDHFDDGAAAGCSNPADTRGDIRMPTRLKWIRKHRGDRIQSQNVNMGSSQGGNMTIDELSQDPFRKIENTDLDPVAVVAQCLDNQWVPRDLLKTMVDEGLSLNDDNVARRRLEDSRHEYLRSILNAPQVIINRAFFFNNPVVYRDFLQEGDSRTAFANLLSTSVLVPYLLRETSLTQKQIFTVQPQGWDAWLRVASETSSSCLRLSWDNEDENNEYVRSYLEKPFRRFLLTMADFEEDALKRDFSLNDEESRDFKRRLQEVSVWAAGTDDVRREKFYEKFVVADDTKPADGCYDRSKPFAAQLKQLADLRYNTTLADAMDRYALTPVDSLHRAAMQEERQLMRVRGVDTEALLEVLLRRRVFDLIQNPLDVGLTGLDLHHVSQARRTDEWSKYISSLRSLIEAPEEFDIRAQDVYSRYVDLAGQISNIVGARRQGLVDRWEPVIQVTIETLGSVISIVFAAEPVVQVVGKVATSIAARASTAVVRFAVVGRDQRRAQRQLGTSVDLMRVQFHRTADEWRQLTDELERAGFRVRDLDRHPEADANLDVPEQSEDDG
jgi:hypothetical protein